MSLSTSSIRQCELSELPEDTAVLIRSEVQRDLDRDARDLIDVDEWDLAYWVTFCVPKSHVPADAKP